MRGRLFVRLLSLCVVLNAAITAMASTDETSAREAIVARFMRLHNLTAQYEVTAIYTPGFAKEDCVRVAPDGNSAKIMNTGTRITKRQWAICQERRLYVTDLVSWDRGFDHPYFERIPSIVYTQNVLTPDRGENLRVSQDKDGKKKYRGWIQKPKRSFPDSEPALEVALGLSILYDPNLMTVEDIQGMDMELLDHGQVALKCVKEHGVQHEWLFDPQFGHALVKYRAYQSGHVQTEHTMDDFRLVDGLMLPFHVQEISRAMPDMVTKTETITVKSYKLDDPNNTPARYHIDWPDRTIVYDGFTGSPFRVSKDSDSN